MNNNVIMFNRSSNLALKPLVLQTGDPSEVMELHEQLHERWRWYGIKPELRRLYELWEEIEVEDKQKQTRRR
ncbi:MAG: hypothetical protein AB1489_37030 [Acidobacteriota bacterium]